MKKKELVRYAEVLISNMNAGLRKQDKNSYEIDDVLDNMNSLLAVLRVLRDYHNPDEYERLLRKIFS